MRCQICFKHKARAWLDCKLVCRECYTEARHENKLAKERAKRNKQRQRK